MWPGLLILHWLWLLQHLAYNLKERKMATRQRRSRSGKSLRAIKAEGTFLAACEAERIAARLQVQLGQEKWGGILAEWEQRPRTVGLPEEHRDFLIGIAGQYNVSLAGI